jgi:hypothetical protein
MSIFDRISDLQTRLWDYSTKQWLQQKYRQEIKTLEKIRNNNDQEIYLIDLLNLCGVLEIEYKCPSPDSLHSFKSQRKIKGKSIGTCIDITLEQPEADKTLLTSPHITKFKKRLLDKIFSESPINQEEPFCTLFEVFHSR